MPESAEPAPRTAMFIFELTIFLSAALLFQVELIVGKELLPWFGGAPSVWTTCLLFFQITLLAGYAYTHFTVQRLKSKTQLIVHGAVILASLILLVYLGTVWPSPITPGPSWQPVGGGEPVGHLLLLLLVSVGLPFFVLSTTGPLLQAWFVSIDSRRSPYPLYALSNAGSFLGLVTYPVLVEPFLTIGQQSTIWSLGYGIVVAGVIVCAANVLKSVPSVVGNKAVEKVRLTLSSAGTESIALWTSLAAVASALLLAVTNHMCQDTAVIPLLWVVPLALYLLTLMLCFEFERFYRRWLFPPLFGVSVVCVIVVMYLGLSVPLIVQVGADAAVLFFGCLVCHGELARSKPDANRLTLFYLCVASGGAIGGISVAVLAPRVFNGFWEFHATLFATGVLFIGALIRDRSSFLNKSPVLIGGALGLCVLAFGGVFVERIVQSGEDVRFRTRNFYGVLRVVEDQGEGYLELMHGRISHGLQYQDSAESRTPTTYYSEESGIGLAIVNHPRRADGLRIGVVGLGVGTIAAYAEEKDTVRFYEINPSVLQLSEGERPFFTYVKDCEGHADVVIGDARLTMEEELRRGDPQRFDVLAVDAFSGDAIPVHLLTKEALEIYRKHLRLPYGLIAFHVSNRYLNLLPLVHALARQAHLLSTEIVIERDESGRFGSDWVLLSPSPAELHLDAIKKAATPWDSVSGRPVRIWTDDYSNLVALLK